MAALAPAPRFYEIDASGNPLASGKVYTYQAGTTTPLATYTDSAAGTANANPVILDAGGRANIWLLASNLYKIVVKDSTDATIYTVDNVGAGVTLPDLANTSSATLGDALVGVKSTLTGGTARTQHTKNADFVSVKDFGATGDGTTNDYAAIQAAIDAVETAGSGVVWFPTGTYKCNTGLLVNVSKTKLQGMYATLDFSSLSSSGTGITLAGTASGTAYANSPGGIEGINLTGPGDATTARALYFNAAAEAGPSYTAYRDGYISGWLNGVFINNNSYLLNFDNMNIRVGGSCVIDTAGATNSGERISFSNCTLSGAQYGLNVQNTNADYVVSNTSIDTTVAAIYARGTEVSVHGGYIECVGQALDSASSGGSNCRVTFSGTRFIQVSSGGATPYINAQADTYLTIIGGSINPHASTTTSIQMSANSRLVLHGTVRNYSGPVDNYNSCARSIWFGASGSILNASEVAATDLSSSGTTTLGGTASALVSFHGATAVDQAAAITSVGTTGIVSGGVGFATTAQAQAMADSINSILVALREKGLIAT